MPPLFAPATKTLLEIDHIFVCIPAAVSPTTLANLGLTCSPQSICRPQQGTVSRSIFFENMYLDLVWVEDEQAAEIYAMQSGIDFLARSQSIQASPFGIALRQTLEDVTEDRTRPFDLLPSVDPIDRHQTFINFAIDNFTAPTEPLCFVIPDAISLLSLLDRTSVWQQQLFSHPAHIKRLTATTLTLRRSSRLSEPLSLLWREGILEIAGLGDDDNGATYLELIFDDHAQARRMDLRELGIPVVLSY